MKKSGKLTVSGGVDIIKVNGQILKVTPVNVKGETVRGKWEFSPAEGITVKCQKMADSPKVTCEVIAGGKTVCKNLSAQAMFDVLVALTGMKRTRANTLFVNSNPFRKDGKKGKITKTIDLTKIEDFQFSPKK